jgi:hypothetical protein
MKRRKVMSKYAYGNLSIRLRKTSMNKMEIKIGDRMKMDLRPDRRAIIQIQEKVTNPQAKWFRLEE